MPSLHQHFDQRSRTGRGSHPSLWLGVIVNITATSVWVRVPQLAQDDIEATNVIAGELTPGDRVVVGLMEGRVDNLVVLAKEQPTVAAHVHLETDLRYPGWASLALFNGWAPTGSAVYFSGLRYRTDSRFLYLNGHVSGGAAGSQLCTLPVSARPVYRSSTQIGNDAGAAVQLTVTQEGGVYSGAVGPLRVNAVVPLT